LNSLNDTDSLFPSVPLRGRCSQFDGITGEKRRTSRPASSPLIGGGDSLDASPKCRAARCDRWLALRRRRQTQNTCLSVSRESVGDRQIRARR
jgi:hypothetical protein